MWNSSPILPGDQFVVCLVAVPEPSTLLAMGTGLAFFVLQRQRRK